jgi:hypothetical protein
MTLEILGNYNPWTLGHKWVGIEGNPLLTEQREKKFKHWMIQPEVRWWLCEKFNGHFFGVHIHGGQFNVGALNLPFDWGRYKDANGNFFGQVKSDMPTGKFNPDGTEIKVSGVEYKKGTDPYSGLVTKFGRDYAGNQTVYSNADRDGIYINSFDGWFVGLGASYGYHWILSRRFSMEFTIGVGYAYLDYEKSRCTDCKQPLEDLTTHYFGPTKAGISLVYMIK